LSYGPIQSFGHRSHTVSAPDAQAGAATGPCCATANTLLPNNPGLFKEEHNVGRSAFLTGRGDVIRVLERGRDPLPGSPGGSRTSRVHVRGGSHAPVPRCVRLRQRPDHDGARTRLLALCYNALHAEHRTVRTGHERRSLRRQSTWATDPGLGCRI
jgi:hypothetical protein